jgi:hypothetical protein
MATASPISRWVAHPKLRVRVMARLAASRHPAASHEAIALARDAVKEARQLGEDRTLLEVLFTALSVFMDFVDPRERIPLNREVAALGLRLGDRPKRLRSFARLFHDHVELGEFETAREYIEAYERLATELQLEHVLWRPAMFRALLGLVQGDFALVEHERQRAERLAGADREAARTLTSQRHGLLFARQELAALSAGIEADTHRLFEELGKEQYGFVPGFCAWAAACAEDAAGARRYWDQIPRDGWQWHADPSALLLLAEIAAAVGDRERAQDLYDQLLPVSGRDVSWGAFGCWWAGPADRGLGLLAASLGRDADADRHFEAALARLALLGARPLLSRTRYEYARCLLARARPNDSARARTLLEGAREVAVSLGQTELIGRIDQRLAAALPIPAGTTRPSQSSSAPDHLSARDGVPEKSWIRNIRPADRAGSRGGILGSHLARTDATLQRLPRLRHAGAAALRTRPALSCARARRLGRERRTGACRGRRLR